MERSTIHYLKKRGFSNTAIGEVVGHHRDTVKKALDEPVLVERQKSERKRLSAASVFDEQIIGWLDQGVKINRMLELAQADPLHPYQGGDTAFYDYVRKIRKTRGLIPANMAVRFEGLPGEFLQIDWGELRHFPFTKAELRGETRYFFAARLKFSRFMFVRFTTDMVEETLLRCLVDCFVVLGGVPWVVTTDNMKTATLGRDEFNQPIWHPAFKQLANEFGFHPEACAPASGNQKGAVENLVKFVKSNFMGGRTFYDSADLDSEQDAWLKKVNYERESKATEKPPAELLLEERPRMGKLPQNAFDYGFFDSLMVNREGFVSFETNKYSVPAILIGQALTARIFKHRLELYADAKLVATHPRSKQRGERIVVPAHFEAAFTHKPRARVMVYRDWLVKLGPVAAEYISEICRTQRGRMNTQMIALYELAQELGTEDFLSALELAAEQQLFGAEYISAIVAASFVPPKPRAISTNENGVERDLALYEQYVANVSQLANNLPGVEVTHYGVLIGGAL